MPDDTAFRQLFLDRSNEALSLLLLMRLIVFTAAQTATSDVDSPFADQSYLGS